MIRPFHPRDAKICHGIFSDCTRTDPYIHPQTQRRLIEMDSPVNFIIRSREYYTVVYDQDAEVWATGGLARNEIRALYVAPTRQRQGIGTKIMEHLESQVDSDRFDLIFLNASPSAEPFYHRMGYRSIRSRSYQIDGWPLHTIYMEKKI